MFAPTKSVVLNRIILALSSAVLLFAAWPSKGVAPLLFIALIPLLMLEDSVLQDQQQGKKARLFWYAFLSLTLFNLLTTFWIYYASGFGMVGAVVTNALIMTVIFQLFHFTRKHAGDLPGYGLLITLWISYELLHMDWDLEWPWLNLGNGFASWANMIQWYEYTGTQGGTLWIWIVNILLFRLYKDGFAAPRSRFLLSAAVIMLPIVLSGVIRMRYVQKHDPLEVIAVQPNIDPYNEKFSGMSSDDQLEKMLKLADPLVTSSTMLVVFPETALPDVIWEEHIEQHPQVLRIREFMRMHPGISVLIGMTSAHFYKPGEPLSTTARSFSNGNAGHFDAYNAAMMITPDDSVQIYHKSRLVPGVEMMPFPKFFGLFGDFAIDLGGTTGSLGVQSEPSVFKAGPILAAPIICYESVYGDYVSQYVRKGANLLCIITNDGWWDDTPGYRQHCQYARLRAIEMRRCIVRSANTGTSCFLNELGEIQQPTAWWVPGAIRQQVDLNTEITFYARYGDYIGRTSVFVAAFLLVFGFYKKLRK